MNTLGHPVSLNRVAHFEDIRTPGRTFCGLRNLDNLYIPRAPLPPVSEPWPHTWCENCQRVQAAIGTKFWTKAVP